jgi:hypothetical protein
MWIATEEQCRVQVNSIVREGKRQRFCQQCGRFHDLTCFDADKRSCRARLQRHNARRRKKNGDAEGTSKQVIKKQNSLPRGRAVREFLRADSSKRQTSDSTSVRAMHATSPSDLQMQL